MNLELSPVWRDYRNRLGALVIGIVGLVLWVDGADGFLLELLGGDAATNALAAAWITGTTGALVWLAAFRCPFCGECFHWTLWVANPIADHCLHCGFQKWRDPDAARVLGSRR